MGSNLDFLMKLQRFLKTGSSDPPTDEEQRRERQGTAGPRVGGITVLFIAFCLLAVIAKLVLQAFTGDSFDLSVNGLLTSFSFAMVAAIFLVGIVILRKLFIWSYGTTESYGEFKPGGGCGMIMLVILGALGLLTLYIRHSYEESQKRLAAAAIATTPKPAAKPEPDVEHTETPATVERAMLTARLNELYAGLYTRWRADVDSAGASGKPGKIPPMLEVTSSAPASWQVKNLAKRPACVRLLRVVELPGGSLQRCRLDAATACKEISVGALRQIALSPDDGSPGCRQATLEFRVGTPMLPEPSWWSASALTELDESPGSRTLDYAKWSDGRMRSEITLIESMTVEPNRAARWRRELGQ